MQNFFPKFIFYNIHGHEILWSDMYRKNLFICNVDTESKLFSKHLDIIYKLYEKYKYDDFVFILFPNKSIETLSINIEEKDLKKYQPILSCIMQISKKQEKEFKKWYHSFLLYSCFYYVDDDTKTTGIKELELDPFKLWYKLFSDKDFKETTRIFTHSDGFEDILGKITYVINSLSVFSLPRVNRGNWTWKKEVKAPDALIKSLWNVDIIEEEQNFELYQPLKIMLDDKKVG